MQDDEIYKDGCQEGELCPFCAVLVVVFVVAVQGLTFYGSRMDEDGSRMHRSSVWSTMEKNKGLLGEK